MHELSLCQAIADTAERYADGRKLERVVVRIGHLRQVVPDSLQFSWQLLTEDTWLDGTELVVEHIPAVIECNGCGQQTTLDLPIMMCRHCESADVSLRSGEEFQIASIDRAREVS